jgi:methyl-accepting chemotaxis protein
MKTDLLFSLWHKVCKITFKVPKKGGMIMLGMLVTGVTILAVGLAAIIGWGELGWLGRMSLSVALLGAASSGWMLWLAKSQPQRDDIKEALSRLAQGDLTKRLVVKKGDALAPLINDLLERQRQYASQLQGAAYRTRTETEAASTGIKNVAEAADAILQAINQVASGASEQAEASIDIRNLAHQVSQEADEIAQLAHCSDELAVRVQTQMQQGNTDIAALAQVLSDLAIHSKEAAAEVDDLSAVAARIGGIADQVNNIASQTSLLALNASIEAARAGEHGRGFAVVAQEVGKLAEESTASTASIKELLGEVEKGVQQVHGKVSNGEARATASAQTAENVRCSLKELFSVYGQTLTAVSQIADKAASQVSGIEHLEDRISRVSSICENAAATAQETAATAGEQQKAMEASARQANNLLSTAKKMDQLAGTLAIEVPLSGQLQEKVEGQVVKVKEQAARLQWDRELLPQLCQLVAADSAIVQAYVTDSHGNMIAETTATEGVTNYADRDWFRLARDKGVYLSNVYLSVDPPAPVVTISVALADGRGVLGIDLGLE